MILNCSERRPHGILVAVILLGASSPASSAMSGCAARSGEARLASYSLFDGPAAEGVELAPDSTSGKGKTFRQEFVLGTEQGRTQFLICRYAGLPEQAIALPAMARRCVAAGDPPSINCR